MKTKYLQLLLAALITLPFLFACDRNEEDEAAEPSKATLLTSHVWQGDKVLLMGIDVTNSDAVPEDAPDVRTLLLTFNSDNTYNAESEVLKVDGKWHFNEDETKINFDFLGLGDVDVKELDDDVLHLGTSVSKAQLTLLAQLLNLDLGPIRNLPDGTDIEAEIRFVKP